MLKSYRKWDGIPSFVVFKCVPVKPCGFVDEALYQKFVDNQGRLIGGNFRQVENVNGVWENKGYGNWEYLPCYIMKVPVRYQVVAEVPMNPRRQWLLFSSFSSAVVHQLITTGSLKIKDINNPRHWTSIARYMQVPLGELMYVIQEARKYYKK